MQRSLSVGLSLVSNYSSSDDSDEDVDRLEQTSENKKSGDERPGKRCRLPLPEEFQVIPKRRLDDYVEDKPGEHDGRMRSFPHERGNWVSYIYIPFKDNYHYDILCDIITDFYLPKIKLKKIEQLHISLTKTFVLFHHWIDQFVGSIKNSLKRTAKFQLSFNTINVYLNEEKTRTFISLEVGCGRNELLESIRSFRNCFNDFRLDPFYEDPSFHMSVAWCLGDVKCQIEEKLPILRHKFNEFIKEAGGSFSICVGQYAFKTGHRIYNLELT